MSKGSGSAPPISANPFAICNHFGFPSPTLCYECIDAIQARAQANYDEEDSKKHKPRKIPLWLKPVYEKWSKVDATNVLLVVIFAFAVMVLLIPLYYHTAVAVRSLRKTAPLGRIGNTNVRRSEPATGRKADKVQLESDFLNKTETVTVFITCFSNVNCDPTMILSDTRTVTVTTTAAGTSKYMISGNFKSANATMRKEQAVTAMISVGIVGPTSTRTSRNTASENHPDLNVVDTTKSLKAVPTSTSQILKNDKFKKKGSRIPGLAKP